MGQMEDSRVNDMADNGYVRHSTCDAIHNGIAEKLSEIKDDVKLIKEAVNPKVQRHDDWIARHDKESEKKTDLSWKLWFLILSPTIGILIKILFDFLDK